MRFFFNCIFILFTANLTFGKQNINFSNLKKEVEFSPDSIRNRVLFFLQTDKYNNAEYQQFYNLLGTSYRLLDNSDSAIYFFEKEDSIIQLLNVNADLIVKNGINLLDIYSKTGKLKEADNIQKRILPFINKVENYQTIHAVLLKCGWISREQGRYNEAISFFTKAKSIAHKNHDSELTADANVKIGIIYHVVEDFPLAKSYYDSALTIYESIHAELKIGNLYNNYGLLFNYQDLWEDAIPYFEKYKTISEKHNYEWGVAIANENLGLIDYNLNNPQMALERFQQSASIWTKLKNDHRKAQTFSYLTYTYNEMGLYKKTIEIGKKALILCENSGAKSVQKEIYEDLSIAYNNLHETTLSYAYYKKYIHLKDSLTEVNNFEKIKLATLENELEKKNYADSLRLTLINQEQEASFVLKNKQKQFWFLSLSIGFFCLVIILFLVIRSRRQKQKTAELIADKNALLELKNNEIIDSIKYAKYIQSATFPSEILLHKCLPNSKILYLPKDIVAGDFYWVQEVNISDGNTITLFAVADCTGHGVPGAMISLICINALNKVVNEEKITTPGKILDAVSNIVTQTFENGKIRVNDGMDISLISIQTKDDTTNVQFAGANNPLWVIRTNSDEIEEIKGNNQYVGKNFKTTPFITHTIHLSKGDLLYMFTDGLADQFGGPKDKKFKMKPFKRLIESVQYLSLDEQKTKIKASFLDWKGDQEQIDDICIGIIEI